MGKFFNVDVIPDIVNGDISNVINADKSSLDIGGGDLLFDWVEIDVPKGASMMRSITAFMNAENCAYHANSLTDLELVFAKSINGEAPTSMGDVNSAQTGGFDLREHWVGGARLEGVAVTATLSKLTFGIGYMAGTMGNDSGGKGGFGLPLVISLDPESGTNVGYDKLYVAGFIISGRNFSTGVVVNGAITSDTATTITVDGVDATKAFSPGDTVYLHDVDTALGTVKSVSANSIELNAAIASGTDLDDDDVLVNANPIRFKFGFEK
jgi:hypothetical protein